MTLTQTGLHIIDGKVGVGKSLLSLQLWYALNNFKKPPFYRVKPKKLNTLFISNENSIKYIQQVAHDTMLFHKEKSVEMRAIIQSTSDEIELIKKNKDKYDCIILDSIEISNNYRKLEEIYWLAYQYNLCIIIEKHSLRDIRDITSEYTIERTNGNVFKFINTKNKRNPTESTKIIYLKKNIFVCGIKYRI
jgi:archaellum biogenesis ATPase FlaH